MAAVAAGKGRRRSTKNKFPKLPLLMLSLLFLISESVAGSEEISSWLPAVSCRGSTAGECKIGIEEADEFSMESESSRRILATSSYISYQSLKRDSTPCTRRGSSYYNCKPGAQANPYTRGCSAITQCRS